MIIKCFFFIIIIIIIASKGNNIFLHHLSSYLSLTRHTLLHQSSLSSPSAADGHPQYPTARLYTAGKLKIYNIYVQARIYAKLCIRCNKYYIYIQYYYNTHTHMYICTYAVNINTYIFPTAAHLSIRT